jgi:hypothetical protein
LRAARMAALSLSGGVGALSSAICGCSTIAASMVMLQRTFTMREGSGVPCASVQQGLH